MEYTSTSKELMHRFFVDKKEGELLYITDPVDVNHLKQVLRLHKGDKVEAVFNKRLFFCEINAIEKEESLIPYEEENREGSPLHLTLLQGLPKGTKVDEILKDGTQVGIDAFILTEMKRSVSKGATKKKERFERILKDAAKQSKALQVPPLSFLSLKEVQYGDYDAIYLLDEEEKEDESFKDLPERVLVIVGPEGGISEEERLFLKEQGAVAKSLEKRILRTELAGVTTAFLLRYLKGQHL